MKQRDPQLKIRLKPETKDWLEKKAKDEERSQTWLINQMMRDEMQREREATAQK